MITLQLYSRLGRPFINIYRIIKSIILKITTSNYLQLYNHTSIKTSISNIFTNYIYNTNMYAPAYSNTNKSTAIVQTYTQQNNFKVFPEYPCFKLSVYAIFQLNTIQTVTSHPVSLCKTKMSFNQRPYFKHIRNEIISKCSTEHS